MVAKVPSVIRAVVASSVISLAIAAGCSDRAPAGPDPTSITPSPTTGGKGIITGIVTERTLEGIRPLANVRVYAWVQIGPYGYSRGDVPTDTRGSYRVDLLPLGSTVFLYPAYPPSDNQPCASIVELADSVAAMDIELVPQEYPLPEAATSLPLITGIVYEMKGNVRQPVAGAYLNFDTQSHSANDFPSLATTTTDVAGRYALCRLPSGGNLHVEKDGYVPYIHDVVVTGSSQLDIELKKR
jgi:hypothetical protein